MAAEFRILRESAEFDFPFSVIQRIWDGLNTAPLAQSLLEQIPFMRS